MTSDQAESTATESTSGLFANESEANLDSTISMIEDILIELGHVVEDCRSESDGKPASWRVKKGSAWTRIEILEEDSKKSKGYRVRVVATVVTLGSDVDKLLLFEKLLRLNASHVRGAAYALRGAEIILTSERSTLDLDRSELWELISVVRDLADENDDKLVAEFGGLTLGSTE